ncbi:MAG: PAS domain-containing protein [Bacteroidota bacterium]
MVSPYWSSCRRTIAIWLADLLHPEDHDSFLNKFLHAFEKKESYSGEFRILNKDGSYNWLFAKVPVRLHPDGSYAGHISSCIDITERKQAEEETKRFKFMADNASDPFILIREDGSFAYLNKLALEKWGYTEEEAKLIRVQDVDENYNAEVFNAVFSQSQKEDIPFLKPHINVKMVRIIPLV